jgi:hypothetical protein
LRAIARHSQSYRACARPKAIAKPRIIVHQKCLSAAIAADEEFPFTETLAAPAGGATAADIRTMPNQALSPGLRCVIWKESRKIAQKLGISGIFDARPYVSVLA